MTFDNSNSKLDYLNMLEKHIPTETNMRKDAKKYFVTFPYPYMNGKLHLGHLYSLSKADFMGYYKRLCGYNVLFPFAFHCTGMPISASAKKLKKELEGEKVDVSIVEILQQFGFNDAEPFVDPEHWIRVFPKCAQQTLEVFHGGIDWRRSFITTSINAYYDSFIRFQFKRLREANLLAFGKRYSIFCRIDRQACLDHDRRRGEGVKPVEALLKKVRVGETTLLLRCKLGEKNRDKYGAKVERIVLGDEEVFELFELDGERYVVEQRLYENMVHQVDRIEHVKQMAVSDLCALAENLEITMVSGKGAKAVLVREGGERQIGEEYENLVRKKNEEMRLVESANFVKIYEPEREVISRSGDECVVSLLDQWYIDYGQEGWKEKARKCVARMKLSNATRLKLEEAVEWISKWGFSRSFGLGTRIPWDETYLVDSLSDSTIYMSFYTFKHLLYGGLAGEEEIFPKEALGDDVWEFVYGGVMEGGLDEVPARLERYSDTLRGCRASLEHFYPVDLRVSGKDLIGNHIVFFIFNHVALFREEFWPQRIFTNGHLMLNSAKMSKSEGNFLSADDALRKFGASATRMGLASCGDTNEDANFEEENANAFVLKLFSLAKNIENLAEHDGTVGTARTMEGLRNMRLGGRPEGGPVECGGEPRSYAEFIEMLLAQSLSRNFRAAIDAYEAMCYRDVVKFAFYENLHAIEQYTLMGGKESAFISSAYKAILQIIYPIVPSFSRALLQSRFGGEIALPEAFTERTNIIVAMDYVKTLINRIISTANGRERCTIVVSKKYPAWKMETMASVDGIVSAGDFGKTNAAADLKKQKAEIIAKLSPLFRSHKINIDRGLRFAMDYHKDRSKYAIVFDEAGSLRLLKPFVEKSAAVSFELEIGEIGEPMKPNIIFHSS